MARRAWVELPAAPPGDPIECNDRPGPAASLPSDILQRIFAMLPHLEHLVHALMTCRAWHAVAQDRMLWASHAARRGSFQAVEVWHGRRKLDSLTAHQWRDLAANAVCSMFCYQCGCEEHGLTAAGSGFRPHLCRDCSDDFQLGRASHRLLSKTEAMFRYKLRAKDLEPLPHAAEPNPINPGFSLMHLYRRPDVVRAAIRRWDGVAAMWKQMRPYRGAGLDDLPCSILVAKGSAADAGSWLPTTCVRSLAE